MFGSDCSPHIERQDNGLTAGELKLPLTTLPFDAVEAIDTPRAQAELLADAKASGNAEVVTAALQMITRSKRMSQTDVKGDAD